MVINHGQYLFRLENNSKPWRANESYEQDGWTESQIWICWKMQGKDIP